jgi:selenocysteine lyase/cysteine desulfurase
VTAPGQGTLVTFRVEGDTAELVKGLYDEGVVVRDVPGQGWIRVSCGWWTSDDDLARLVAALP